MKKTRAKASRQRKQESQKREKRNAHRNRVRQWADQQRPMLRAGRLVYEFSERACGVSVAGLGVVHGMTECLGLGRAIDRRLRLLLLHQPYFESDHVLNLAFNTMAGGTCLEDLEQLRQDEGYVQMLGAQRIPDPTTAGDFCRRFEREDILDLMKATHEARRKVWKLQPISFFREALIDVDATLVPTTGECKQGMNIAYNGVWGYHVLLVSLANTREPLYVVNRSGNRPSSEGAAEWLDRAIALCREAGFRKVTLRGDTDFSQSAQLDRWHDARVRFLFGFDARANLIAQAQSLPPGAWQRLKRPRLYEVKTHARARPEQVKEALVEAHEYENIRLIEEHVAEFAYRPTLCKHTYRMIVVRKHLQVRKGQQELFEEDRFFFYVTNETGRSCDLVFKANDRCDQENLIEQLKNGTRSLRAPVDTLLSNWAYMVMTALAWNLKAWTALLLPEEGRWSELHRADKETLLRMEFRKYVNMMIRFPAQLIRRGRQLVLRLMTWNPWQRVFLRLLNVIDAPLRC